jgi:secreted PhoX family phosphatase
MCIVKRFTTFACAVAVTAAITACAGSGNVKTAPEKAFSAEKSIIFEGVKAPATDAEKRDILASGKVTINGKEYAIGYNTILRSGENPQGNPANGTFGLMFDKDGKEIINKDGSKFISVSNDFASLITGRDGNLYMVSHFENSPGAIYITALSQDKATGKLTAMKTRHIDYSNVKGGWVHCAGSVTPWGAHLASEEYEPDARKVDPVTGNFNDEYDFSQTKYFGLDPKDTKPAAFKDMNAYDYGYQIEINVDDYDYVKVAKHYAMGRVAHELSYVMPDGKTAYISDDGTNVGLFRFVADKKGDLSAGTLYVAKWIQKKAVGGGEADLGWISLGHSTDAEIAHYINEKVSFYDIFDAEEAKDGKCSTPGFTHINTTTGKECLKVKKGMAKAASRLETRRYAAIMGGTTEFRKMEGITLDPDTNTMYLAISEVSRGMENMKKNGKPSSSYDGGGYNDIRLMLNNCGAVYALDLDENYVAKNMYAVVKGKPLTIGYGAFNDSKMYEKGSEFENNKCDLDGISNPDNLTFMPGYNTLIIGEDTGSGHQNDVIWSYNLKDKKLTRIQTTPYGSETTSPYFYPNINGWAYMMSVIQHPYGESDEDKTTPGSEATRGYTGYVGPFPAMD